MKRVTVEATPLVAEINFLPADEFGENEDQLSVQISRGGELILNEKLSRGEALIQAHFDEQVTRDELTRLNATIALEWLRWRNTTLESAPVKTTLELFEELKAQVEGSRHDA